MLSKENVKLYSANNGLEALNICKINPDIDVILMDIRMPVMDGLTALTKIHEIRKQLPIIAQTAFALEQDKKRFLDAGFADYISKPIDGKVLFEKISKIVKTR